MVRRLAAALVVSFAATTAFANELVVDHRTIHLEEALTIIVTLEDDFATVDMVNVPVKNLEVDGAPSVSSQFSWINGSVVRRKVFRFTAHAQEVGPALVGPLVVVGGRGQRETLPPLSVQVVADEASASNDPLTILRELEATGREPLFITAEADRTSAYVGEQIVVTWYLYNAANVQRWQVTRVPKLGDFWSEEIDSRNLPASTVIVGTQAMERVVLRRVAIFPLRSGKLTIGGMEVGAAVLRRQNDTPFGFFEGTVIESHFRSASLNADIRPLPAGAESDIVGNVSLECTTPIQRAGGPVTFTATLLGRANLRTATAPRFSGPIAGEFEVQPLAVNVERMRDGVVMSRKWSYVIFPASTGTMTIPAVTARVFDPASGRREVRCASATLEVQAADLNGAPAPSPASGGSTGNVPLSDERLIAIIVGGVVALLILIFSIKPLSRSLRVRREVRRIMNSGNIREAVDAMVDKNTIANEASERGDAYRSLRSLLDALDRDRVLQGEADLERRVRDLVQSLR